MKVLVGEGLDGKGRLISDSPTVDHPLVQLGEYIIVAADSTWRMATTVASMTATDLFEKMT